MERAGSFTAVPGTGGIVMGLSAFAAAMAVTNDPTIQSSFRKEMEAARALVNANR